LCSPETNNRSLESYERIFAWLDSTGIDLVRISTKWITVLYGKTWPFAMGERVKSSGPPVFPNLSGY
jgi:hypothetical protein